MFDIATPRGKIADAALRLAEDKPWADISLIDIAVAADVSLAELRKCYGSKGQIIAAIMRAFDDKVLSNAAKASEGNSARDQLFEVVMSRFDAMQPYKAALRSIVGASSADATLAQPFLNSQRWMLAAAGIEADGIAGLVRSGGLGAVYRQVLDIWLRDDDPGMAKTMAALDQRLRRGERALSAFDGICGGVSRVAGELPGVLRSLFRGVPRRSDRASQ